MAISGIINCDAEDNELFEDRSILHEMATQLKSPDSVNYLDSLIKHKDFVKKHNLITDSLLEKKLEEIDVDEPLGFALFFIKKNNLYRYTMFPGHSEMNSVIQVEPNVSSSSARQLTLAEIIKKQNKDSKYVYLDDVTVFSKFSEQEPKELNLNSTGKFIALTLVILLLYILFSLSPSEEAYGLLASSTNLIFADSNGSYYLPNINEKKDLMPYLKNVLFKVLYNDFATMDKFEEEIRISDTSVRNDAGSENLVDEEANLILDISENTYIYSRKNIFSGLVIGFNLIQSEEVKVDEVNLRVKETESTYWGPEYQKDTSEWLNFQYKSNLNNFGGGFYLPVYSKLNSYNSEFSLQMIETIIQENLLNLNISLLLYNSDYKTVLSLESDFSFNQFDESKFSHISLAFLPFLTSSNAYIWLVIALCVFLLLLIGMTLLVIKTFSVHFRDSIEALKIEIPWYDYLDIIVLVLFYVLTLLIVFTFLVNVNSFPIILSSIDEFTYWISHSKSINTFHRIASVVLLLSMLWMVRFIYTAFPTLGAVFRTLTNAGSELLGFFSLIIVILVVFVFATHISFGYYRENYNDLNKTLLNIFLMFLGFTETSDFDGQFGSNTLAPFFLIGFNFLFNFIIFNIFLSIIRYSYIETKEKNDTFIEVYNLIVKEKSSDLRTNIIDLLLFKQPPEKEKARQITDSHELVPQESEGDEEKDKEDKEENKKEENKEEVKGEKKEKNRVKASLWQIFSFNLSKLNISSLFTENKSMSKEEFQEKKKKYLKVVEKQRMQQSLKEIEIDYSAEFSLLSQTCIYIVFITVYVSMFLMQARHRSAYEAKIYSNKLFASREGAHYKRYEEVFESIEALYADQYLPEDIYGLESDCPAGSFIGSQNTASEEDELDNESTNFPYNDPEFREKNSCDSTFNQCKIPGSLFLADPFYRLTVRVLQYNRNDYSDDNEFFKYKLSDPSPLDKDNCASDSEIKSTLSTSYNLNGSEVTVNFKYNPVEQLNTAFNCGGYINLAGYINPVCDDPQTFTKAELPTVYPMLRDFFQTLPIGSMFLETFFLDYNNRLFTLIRYNYISTPNGEISYTTDIDVIPLNFYNKTSDYYRMFIEVIYVLFVVYQTSYLISGIWDILGRTIEKEFQERQVKEDLTWFEKYYDLDFEELIQGSAFHAVTSFLTKIVIYSIKLAYQIILSTYIYIGESVFNLIDLTSIMLSYTSIVSWLQIISLTYDINFNVTRAKDDDFSGERLNLDILFQLQDLYNSYFMLVSINSFILICRILRFLRFSKKIYSFIWLLKKSKVSIIFNLFITFIVFLGYVLMGMTVYGQNLSEFKNFNNSLFTVVTLLMGDIKVQEMIEVDGILTVIFIISFKFTFILVLLNLLASIIVDSYYYIKQQQKKSDILYESLYSNLKMIVRNKMMMFNESCELYYANIKIMIETMITPSVQKIDEENKKSYGKKKFWFGVPKANQTAYFFQELKTTSQNIKKKTMNCKRIEIEDGNMVDVPVELNGDFSSGLTIWKKMYIYLLYHTDNESTFEDLIELFKEEKKVTTKKHTTEIKKLYTSSKSVFKDILSNYKTANPDDVDLSEMFLDKAKEAFKQSKSLIINKDLFSGKIERTTYSVDFKGNIESLDNLNKLYSVSQTSFKDMININLLVECVKYPDCKQMPVCNCYQASSNYQAFYDILTKYFFAPMPLPPTHVREVYTALYLKMLKDSKFNFSTNEIEKVMVEIKFSKIVEEVFEFLEENRYTDLATNLTAFQSAFNFFMIASKKLDLSMMEDLYKKSELKGYIEKENNLVNEDLFEPFERYLSDKFGLKEEKEYEEKGIKKTLNFEAYIVNLVNAASLEEGLKIEQKYSSSYIYFHKKDMLGMHVDGNRYENINIPLEDNTEQYVYAINKELWEKYNFDLRSVLFFGYNRIIFEDEELVKKCILEGAAVESKNIKFFTDYQKGYFYTMMGLPKELGMNLAFELKKHIKQLTKKEMTEYKGDNIEKLLKFVLNDNYNYDVYFEIVWKQVESSFSKIKEARAEIDSDMKLMEIQFKQNLNGSSKEVVQEWIGFFNNYVSLKKMEFLKKKLAEEGGKPELLEPILLFASDTALNCLVCC